MLPLKNDPDYVDRVEFLRNIATQWNTPTDETRSIPQHMRYKGHISAWPLSILRAISELASDMPGEDAWNKMYDLLEEGQIKRTQDKPNTVLKQLQLSDLAYVR
jgi:hypothetical protein